MFRFIGKTNIRTKNKIAIITLAILILFRIDSSIAHAAAAPTVPSLQVLAGAPRHETAVIGADNVIVGRFTLTANSDAELERFEVALRGDDDGVVGFGQTIGDLEPAAAIRSCRLLSDGVVIASSEVPELGTVGYLRFSPIASLQALTPKNLEVSCNFADVAIVSGNPDTYFASIVTPADIGATISPGIYIEPQDIYLGRHHFGANAFGNTISAQIISRGQLLSAVAPSTPRGTSLARGDSRVHMATFGFMSEHEDFVIENLQIDHLAPSRTLGMISLEYTDCYGNTVTHSMLPSSANTSQFTNLEVCVMEGRPSIVRVYADIAQTAFFGDTLTFGLATSAPNAFTAHGLVSGAAIHEVDNQQIPTLWGETFVVTR